MLLAGSTRSPSIPNGVLAWFEGDVFTINLKGKILDQDKNPVVMPEGATLTLRVYNERREIVKEFERVPDENGNITIDIDEETTALFPWGKYKGQMIYADANRRSTIGVYDIVVGDIEHHKHNKYSVDAEFVGWISRGVKYARIDLRGHLLLYMTDGNVLDLGETGAGGGFGGYYKPTVSEDGILTWTPSDPDMPAAEAANVQGPAGKDGEPGTPGRDGVDGADGGYYIPSVSQDGDLTWTPSMADMPVVEGANIQGPPGKDGTSVTIESTTSSEEPGGINEVTFSGGEKLQIRNGLNGKDGADGAPGPPGSDATVTATSVSEAIGALDAAQAAAAVEVLSALPLSGGTLTGALDMGGQALSGVPDPASNGDAANKGYVDAAAATAASGALSTAKSYAAGMRVRNLLDNSDFTNPVNQRGFTQSSDPWAYTIDRWQKDEKCTARIVTGLEKVGQAFAIDVGYIFQRAGVDLKTGQPYTFAVWFYFNNGAISLSNRITDSGYVPETVSTDSSGVALLNFTSPADIKASTGETYFRINATSTVGILYAALYEGSYTAETLPPYVPKGYTAELAECQRYCITTDYTSIRFLTGYGYSTTATTFNAFFNVPSELRSKPSLSNTDASKWYIDIGGYRVQATEISIWFSSKNHILGMKFTAKDLPIHYAGIVTYNSPDLLVISADL